MTLVVADTGPLLALAKIDALWLLQLLYSRVWITPVVGREAIDAGMRIGASDATVIDAAVQNGWIEVHAPTALHLPVPGLLGLGEVSSIALALEHAVDWLLIDDADARRLAELNIAAAGAPTRIKGTLGVIVSSFQADIVDAPQAISLIQALKHRPDIWIGDALCDRVISQLKSAP